MTDKADEVRRTFPGPDNAYTPATPDIEHLKFKNAEAANRWHSQPTKKRGTQSDNGLPRTSTHARLEKGAAPALSREQPAAGQPQPEAGSAPAVPLAQGGVSEPQQIDAWLAQHGNADDVQKALRGEIKELGSLNPEQQVYLVSQAAARMTPAETQTVTGSYLQGINTTLSEQGPEVAAKGVMTAAATLQSQGPQNEAFQRAVVASADKILIEPRAEAVRKAYQYGTTSSRSIAAVKALKEQTKGLPPYVAAGVLSAVKEPVLKPIAKALDQMPERARQEVYNGISDVTGIAAQSPETYHAVAETAQVLSVAFAYSTWSAYTIQSSIAEGHGAALALELASDSQRFTGRGALPPEVRKEWAEHAIDHGFKELRDNVKKSVFEQIKVTWPLRQAQASLAPFLERTLGKDKAAEVLAGGAADYLNDHKEIVEAYRAASERSDALALGAFRTLRDFQRAEGRKSITPELLSAVHNSWKEADDVVRSAFAQSDEVAQSVSDLAHGARAQELFDVPDPASVGKYDRFILASRSYAKEAFLWMGMKPSGDYPRFNNKATISQGEIGKLGRMWGNLWGEQLEKAYGSPLKAKDLVGNKVAEVSFVKGTQLRGWLNFAGLGTFVATALHTHEKIRQNPDDYNNYLKLAYSYLGIFREGAETAGVLAMQLAPYGNLASKINPSLIVTSGISKPLRAETKWTNFVTNWRGQTFSTKLMATHAGMFGVTNLVDAYNVWGKDKLLASMYGGIGGLSFVRPSYQLPSKVLPMMFRGLQFYGVSAALAAGAVIRQDYIEAGVIEDAAKEYFLDKTYSPRTSAALANYSSDGLGPLDPWAAMMDAVAAERRQRGDTRDIFKETHAWLLNNPDPELLGLFAEGMRRLKPDDKGGYKAAQPSDSYVATASDMKRWVVPWWWDPKTLNGARQLGKLDGLNVPGAYD